MFYINGGVASTNNGGGGGGGRFLIYFTRSIDITMYPLMTS